MKPISNNWSVFSLLLLFASCSQPPQSHEAFTADDYHNSIKQLIDISMEDIYSPPVASRVFVYPNLAAYELMLHKSKQSIMQRIDSSWNHTNFPDSTQIDFSIASLRAYCLVAKKLVFSEHLIDSLELTLFHKIKESKRSKASNDYGTLIANTFIAWMLKDNYAYVKSADFFTIPKSDSTWQITPPAYEKALEPNWKSLRPILMADAAQFYPPPPPTFSTDKQSTFYKEAKLIYDNSIKQSDSTKQIAKYWDCNPNEHFNVGHSTHFTHRISPPGHWLNITKDMCKYHNLSFAEVTKVYAATTIAMFDGIISCWHTKFTRQLVRPVTYINKFIDPHWEPFIQTPPFPEYTSGHSVISGAASTVLESYFGKTQFSDSTEVAFGFPVKTFASVWDAAEQASISRFYGGIHYTFGLTEGLHQGRKIGNYTITKINATN